MMFTTTTYRYNNYHSLLGIPPTVCFHWCTLCTPSSVLDIWIIKNNGLTDLLNLKLIDSINAFTLDLLILAGWIVMGSLVAIVAVLAGIVITILLIVIYVLWKR